jgi:pyruvate dehydrogenase E1 component
LIIAFSRHQIALHHLGKDGGAVYLRLSTRSIVQPVREGGDREKDAIKGGYWLRRPGHDAEAALVFTGALAPEPWLLSICCSKIFRALAY